MDRIDWCSDCRLSSVPFRSNTSDDIHPSQDLSTKSKPTIICMLWSDDLSYHSPIAVGRFSFFLAIYLLRKELYRDSSLLLGSKDGDKTFLSRRLSDEGSSKNNFERILCGRSHAVHSAAVSNPQSNQELAIFWNQTKAITCQFWGCYQTTDFLLI